MTRVTNPDPDVRTFLEKSATYMNINALGRDWEGGFVRAIRKLKVEETKEAFRRGFAKSILGGITPREYEKATGWDFDSASEFVEHLRKYWALFYPDSNPEDWSTNSVLASEEPYKGYRREEGDKVWYTVERQDGVDVVHVEKIELTDRVLGVSYDLRSPSIYDGFAQRLIATKILGDVCLDSYRSKADTIEFRSARAGLVSTFPYAQLVKREPGRVD